MSIKMHNTVLKYARLMRDVVSTQKIERAAYLVRRLGHERENGKYE
jgi:hypothetical protein